MNRQIKFRGKQKENEEWIIGDFTQSIDHTGKVVFSGIFEQSLTAGHFPVIYETVGQFTGLLDKNGVEIYEGDIIEVYGCSNYYEIKYVGGGFCMHHADTNYMWLGDYKDRLHLITVIENMHDNPELLNTSTMNEQQKNENYIADVLEFYMYQQETL